MNAVLKSMTKIDYRALLYKVNELYLALCCEFIPGELTNVLELKNNNI